ncbi:HAMP domain-containing histidine kinase [Bacillus sp. Bva_UNVM-123]|uniref:sensor histidine kinase n=1 Tax=Bacillus sp. Bva_UNVM-123 TaxID=2829798 RepID=UPI00391F2F4B
MKFWQKIYLYSLLTFVLIFNLSSILIIERNHSKMLDQEITSTLNENMNIQTSVNAIMPIMHIYDSDDYDRTVLEQIANEFIFQNHNQKIYIEINDENNLPIYRSNENLTLPKLRKESEGIETGEIRYILRDVENQTLLSTTNLIEVQKKTYLFTYTKDITHLYQERVEQYQFFLKMDLAACLIYMLIMVFISKGLTRPIDKLIKTVKVIARGDFTERVSIHSKDEVGILANNFNVMAEVVEKTINELELRNSEKERFIQNFTHEIKTPLTSIMGYANYLRLTKYDEETFVDGLSVISSEAKRLESLSFKLMDLILLKEDQFQMKIHDLKEMVEEILPLLIINAQEKQIAIRMECQSCRLQFESDLMKLVIMNLVDNAIKASPKNSLIVIRTYCEENRAVLEVIDQGVGIPKEHFDKLFEPFYMVDKARTRKHNGAGLGLSICQSVANLHHASIEVESKEKHGTTIRVVFKLQER